MSIWIRILRLWLPAAVAVTAACGITYLGVQQSYRMGLNDPQVQLAEDGAALLDAGATPLSVAGSSTVDIARSLTPFVMVFGADDAPLATAAVLDGEAPQPPAGVLESARSHGTNSVTWQPSRGVRIASVSVATTDGRVVVAGRNMRAAEDRIGAFGKLSVLAWLCALFGTLIASWVGETMVAKVERMGG